MLLILNFLLHLTFIPHKKTLVYKSKNIALIVSILTTLNLDMVRVSW